MRLKEMREEVIHYGKEMLLCGLTTGTGGNLSMADRESGLMGITPSGIPYPEIKPEQIVLIDIESGQVVEGAAVPSSECDMHRIFYKYRTDISAMVHTHSPDAATLACLGKPLPAIHYLIALAGGADVRCAEYATYGTVKLAKNAYEAMRNRTAVLLANHGLLTGGKTLGEAFDTAEKIEFCCGLYLKALAVGNPVCLSEEEMQHMVMRFQDYGKRMEEHESI